MPYEALPRLLTAGSGRCRQSHIYVADGVIRIEFDRLLTFFRGSVVMARPLGREGRQKSVGREIPGVLLGPRFKSLSRHFQVSGYLPVIVESDEIVLLIANAIS